MIKKIPFVIAAMALGCQLAYAQTKPQGAAVVASEPGKAMAAETIKASVVVTKIDKASRTVTMKSASGELFEVVAGDEVRNFDQIKVGNQVVVQYVRALSLELKKAGTKSSGPTVATDAVRAKQGDKPGAAVGQQVTVMTTVTNVDPQNKTISLKGPKGNVVVLNVQNPDQFKVVKKGDKVEAVYTEAVAISVEPAAKKK